MSLVKDIYNRSPVFFQNVMVSAYGYQWHKRRFGGIFADEYRRFKERENFTAEQWKDYQVLQLRKLLVHSFTTVPFYREQYKKAGLTIADLQKFEIEDISKLPFLEKDELRKYGDNNLLSEKKSAGTFFSSSGSTGTPTKIYYSPEMHQKITAAMESRVRNWAGVDRFSPRGMIGGRRVVPNGESKPPFYRYNFIEKQIYFSAYHISPENSKQYLEAILKYKPDYMTGYAMSNYFLAYFFDELSLKVPQLKAVITSSEKLTPEMRSLFLKVYGCKTFDGWSGVENCGLISECEQGNLHMSPDTGVIEVIDDNGNQVKPGETGEVVCTGFFNYDQPLIRYRIGDKITLSAKTCSCGRSMQVVGEIVGRTEDVIIGKDGRRMVRFHGIFVDIPSIVKGQVIQESLDEITVKLVTSSPLTQGENDSIKKRVSSQLGDVIVTVEEVKEIPLTSNGKFKAVVSKLKKN